MNYIKPYYQDRVKNFDSMINRNQIYQGEKIKIKFQILYFDHNDFNLSVVKINLRSKTFLNHILIKIRKNVSLIFSYLKLFQL